MSRMEGCMGEESFQLWELNRRLEAYLARVKALEEQNELLSAELGGLRAQASESWRARADDELAALRALVDQRWREKYAAEVARDNLAEELEGVAGRCQQLRLARERTAEEVARSRQTVEAEKCARGWLSSQVAELERELEALRAAHEEERANLNARATCVPRGPAPPRVPPAPAPEVEELAQRLGEAWRGAVRGYQERVAHMETSLGQARERLGRAVQGVRDSRLELQQLQAERGGLQERRAALEQRLEGRWQERLRATENFQLAVEALEQEKQGLQSQIAQILEGRQQLAHLKMSLSLEVATYRTLLEAENSRLQTSGCNSKVPLSFHDPKLELHFLGTPDSRRVGPVLPVLSPAPLPSPLPDSLETPVPAFLKSQEFLQPRAPTLASTPIPPVLQPPCAASKTELRAPEGPVSTLPPQDGRQQAAQPLWAEAKTSSPGNILPGPEEPGGEQPEPSSSQVPENQTLPLSPEQPSSDAKDREPSGSRVDSIFQEEEEGHLAGLVEEETAMEVKVASKLQQETEQDGALAMEEIEDSQSPLDKASPKALGEEILKPWVPLASQSQQVLEQENQEPLRSLEEGSLDTLDSPKAESSEPLEHRGEKDPEAEGLMGEERPALLQAAWKEDPQTLPSPAMEDQGLIVSLDSNLETLKFPGKENGELVPSPKEEEVEVPRTAKDGTWEPLRPEEAQDQQARMAPREETGESLGSSEDENPEVLRPLGREPHEPLRLGEEEEQGALGALEKQNSDAEEEGQKIVTALERELQEPLRLGEEEDQAVLEAPGENKEVLRLGDEEKQVALGGLENETLQSWRALAETLTPVEKVGPEPLPCPSADQEEVRPEEEITEFSESQEDEFAKARESSEPEDLEPPKLAEEGLQVQKSPEVPLWSLEAIPLALEPLGPVEGHPEALQTLKDRDQETLRSPGEGCPEEEEEDEESQRDVAGVEEEEKAEKQVETPLRQLAEEWQKPSPSADEQKWGNVLEEGQDPSHECPGEPAGVSGEEEAELDPRQPEGSAGQEEAVMSAELQLHAAELVAEQPGSPEPREQSVLARTACGMGGTEGLQDPEGQVEHLGAPGLRAPQAIAEATESLWEDDQLSPEVTLESEIATGESAEGTEQADIGLDSLDHLAREEVMQPSSGEESLEARRVPGLEAPAQHLQEADALQAKPSPLGASREPPKSPEEGLKASEPPMLWTAEEVPANTLDQNAPESRPLESEAAEENTPSPGPIESYVPSSIPEGAYETPPQAEGNQMVSWGLGDKVQGEQEDLDSGGISESLQEEGEESREGSEADELGETLPDSTPLGLYLGSPSSPRWGLAGEQRPSPQGEAREEGWDTAAPASEGLEAQPSGKEEEEEEEDGEEEHDRGSDLSEEFEDLGTQVSLLPGLPREAAAPPGQVPQLLEAAIWNPDGESDGFADEEESGEEGEEEEKEEGRKPGAGQWEPGSPPGSLQALHSPPRGDFLESESETVGVSIPQDDDGLRGAKAKAPKSQDSAEPSGSEEESDSAPWAGEDQVPMETSRRDGDTSPGTGDTLAINGQGPNMMSEQVNGGVVNGLQRPAGVGQAPAGDRGSPVAEEEEEGATLKTPWAGVPFQVGPSPFLKFTQREGEEDSWSSGED
ncbi:nestin [Ochotona princeps]|uniref:nestin n=1 Tax=Ochotona princeps TaxID=9978 RepID=UPI002714A2DC|nr:nestin [Ochotona princeps]